MQRIIVERASKEPFFIVYTDELMQARENRASKHAYYCSGMRLYLREIYKALFSWKKKHVRQDRSGAKDCLKAEIPSGMDRAAGKSN